MNVDLKFRLALLVLLALAVTACQGRRFEPASSVSKFRILGLQASPPEIRPGQTTTLRALAVRPGDGPISYRWTWCPFATQGNNYFECPVTQEELEAQIADNLPDGVPPSVFQLPDFDLGTESAAALPYPIAQPLLVALCQAIAQASADAAEEDSRFAGVIPQLSCDEGYEISIRLIATLGDQPATDEMLANLRAQDQNEVIVTGKRVTLWIDSENEPDINPIVEELQIRPLHEEDREKLLDAGHDWVDELDDFEDDWHTIDPDDPPAVLVGVRYELRSRVDPDSIQFYSKLAPAGGDDDERYRPPASEVLVYNWFTTAGALSDDESIYVEGRNTLESAGVTEFFIPLTDTTQDFGGANGERFIDSCPELDDADTQNGCEVRVWSVVRDDRRGQGWLEARVLATGIEPEGHESGSSGPDFGTN